MTPFRLSPDGRRLAATVYEVEKGGMSVWLYDSSDGTSRRLTTGRETEAMAVWAPDGNRIAFGRAAGATPKLYARTNPYTATEPLPQAAFQLPTDWSRDSRFILYQTTGGSGEAGADIMVADLAAGKVIPILRSEAQEVEGVFSPDGKLIAFNSDETGRPELYLQPFAPAPEPHVTCEKRQLSQEGASIVRWRADGRELCYIDSGDWLRAIEIGPNGRPGAERKLFRLNFPPRQLTAAGPALGFDVSPDGQRFLVPDTTDIRPAPFLVIQNWTGLLRGRSQ
jgi:Tol biopolymer transport system component